jgi:hypothetical protein
MQCNREGCEFSFFWLLISVCDFFGCQAIIAADKGSELIWT